MNSLIGQQSLQGHVITALRIPPILHSVAASLGKLVIGVLNRDKQDKTTRAMQMQRKFQCSVAKQGLVVLLMRFWQTSFPKRCYFTSSHPAISVP